MHAVEEFYRPDTEVMEDSLLTCALLSQCGAGPVLPCEILSVEHGLDSLSK